MVKIIVKDIELGESFPFKGLTQAICYARATRGVVITIVNDGKNKYVTRFKDGKSVSRKTIALTA